MSEQLELISTNSDQRNQCSPNYSEHHSGKDKCPLWTTLVVVNILDQRYISHFFWNKRPYFSIVAADTSFGAPSKIKHMSWELFYICLLQGQHSRDVTAIIKHLIVILNAFIRCITQAWTINFTTPAELGNTTSNQSWLGAVCAIKRLINH